jgi:hypothetical protein
MIPLKNDNNGDDMFEKNKTVLDMDKKQVVLMIKQLFDSNIEDLPEEFSEIDPVLFYTETIREKEKRGYHDKITIPCNYLVDKAELIINKVEESRRKLTGNQFDELWNCFDVSLDFSVWGSSVWEPRILPNGAVLIRNIQKIIGLNDQVSGAFNIRASQVRKDLEEVQNYLVSKKPLHDEDTLSFSILHRDEMGFLWTRDIPEVLSEVGQTLVFLSKDFIQRMRNSGKVNSTNIFISDAMLKVAEKSASEHCVLRVFKYASYIYGTNRLGDEYDTILESYSYRLGSDPINNEPIKKEVSSSFDFIKNYIKEVTLKETPEIYETEVIKQNRTIKVLMMDKIHEDYSSKKSQQIDAVMPVFGHYWDRPVSYYNENTQFWNIAQMNKGYMFLVNLSYSYLPSVKNALAEFRHSLIKTISEIQDPNVQTLLYLPLKELNYLNEDDVFIYGSPECNKRMEKVMRELGKKTSATITFEELAKYEDEELAEKEFLAMSGAEYKFSILFVTPKAPVIEDCHQYGLTISKNMNTSLTVHIPNYGYNQGYSSGNLDAGNASQFLLN